MGRRRPRQRHGEVSLGGKLVQGVGWEAASVQGPEWVVEGWKARMWGWGWQVHAVGGMKGAGRRVSPLGTSAEEIASVGLS